MGSFTFDESLAGNGVDYVSPDSLAKIMGDYGYHDSRSFLDCNLDVWSDELVGILGYEAFGSSQSEALVLSPLADKESVLQLFYTFSEKADGLISDELFNTLYWEMEAEERFAHARPIEAVDIDFDRPATSHRVACIVKSSLKTIYPSALPWISFPNSTGMDLPSPSMRLTISQIRRNSVSKP
ncbi:hypothetical protein [Collinsella stercoris]|uniref:hypothetical protein n=1 Tax=Collinsella stercoris TaxID=147206 RepID=UPI00399197FB